MLTQYRLKNKLKVLLIESHKSPVVAVQMWVKTGSADEKKGLEGISHFIEHLVFKGTRKFGVGEVAQTVEAAGGEINAYTTYDYTVFHITISKDELKTALECISEMMGFPTFDAAEIDKEREVVLEEIKRGFDNPGNVSGRQLFSGMFKKHSYGIPVIGYDKTIKTVSPKKLLEYFHKRYVPSNMTLVVSGDFEKSKIKEQVEGFFGAFGAFPLEKLKRVKEPAQKTYRVNYKPSSFQEASLNIAFRGPQASHPDAPALDVLGFILGQGDSSRLVRRLRLESSLVTNISSGSFSFADAGLFVIGVHCNIENLKEVHKILLTEIEDLLKEPLEYAELKRAQLNLEADEIFALESVDGMARKAGVFQTLLEDPQFIKKYIKEIQTLKPEKILKVARKYLKPENLNMNLMLNEKDTDKVTETEFKAMTREMVQVLKRGAKNKASKVKDTVKKLKILKAEIKSSSEKSPIIKKTLSSGAKLILKKNSEVPIMSIKAGFLGGLRLEKPETQGVTMLLSSTWTSGSLNYSEQKVASTIEGCAGSLSANGGRNTVSLGLETLSVFKNEAWDVFCDVLTSPLFPQEAVSREATLQLEDVKNKEDRPVSRVSHIFTEKIFEGHPYAMDVLGTEESIKNLNSAKVFAHWEKMVSSKNATFTIVGDFDEDEMIEKFDKLSKLLKPGIKHDEVFPLKNLTPQKVFAKSNKEQTHIIVGFRGLSLRDPDRYAAEVLQAILSGQGGRLFLELRDKASLAYTVAPLSLPGIETGYFGAYIGCSPEKGGRAISMIRDELYKMSNGGPTDKELDRAKRYLAGRHDIDLQRNSAQGSSILWDEIYDIDCEETFRYSEHVKHLTPQDIKKLAQRLFESPEILAAVGPYEPWT